MNDLWQACNESKSKIFYASTHRRLGCSFFFKKKTFSNNPFLGFKSELCISKYFSTHIFFENWWWQRVEGDWCWNLPKNIETNYIKKTIWFIYKLIICCIYLLHYNILSKFFKNFNPFFVVLCLLKYSNLHTFI
jgi:hypothetical protein